MQHIAGGEQREWFATFHDVGAVTGTRGGDEDQAVMIERVDPLRRNDGLIPRWNEDQQPVTVRRRSFRYVQRKTFAGEIDRLRVGCRAEPACDQRT